MVEIEKGVRVPKTKSGSPTKYPWATMEIGDSFLVERGIGISGVGIPSAHKKYLPKRFLSRTVEVDGEKRVRVWRYA